MTWFKAFIKAHLGRHPHGQWPKTAEEIQPFFRRWKGDFQRHRVTEAEAHGASERFRAPQWPNQHLDALIAHVRSERAASGQTAGGCGRCSNGLVSLDGVAAYCHCQRGQWVKKTHLTAEDPGLATRFRQAAPQPHWDDAAIDALWNDIDDSQRAMWLREAAERHPATARLKPVWLASVAKVAAYRAEVLSEDPFETEMEVA